MNTYLAHHGVSGMKWGVWNEETRRKRMGGVQSPRQIKRDLNKLDAQLARKRASYMKAVDSATSLQRKQSKIRSKRSGEKITRKYESAIDKYHDRDHEVREIKSKINTKIKEAKSLGYVVEKKQVIRDGRSYAEQILTGAAGGASSAVGMASFYNSKYSKAGNRYVTTFNDKTFLENPMRIVGNKYKVK